MKPSVQEIENLICSKFKFSEKFGLASFLIDFTKFSDNTLYQIVKSSTYLIPLLTLSLFSYQNDMIKKIAELVKINFTNSIKNIQVEDFLSGVHNYMTTSQLEYYLNVLPDEYNKDILFNDIIKRKFFSQLEFISNNLREEKLKKREILLQIHEYLKDKPLTFNSMRCDNLLSILENGIELNIYDKNLFKAYLQNPIYCEIYNLTKEKFQIVENWSKNRHTICNIANKSKNEENNIISKYLFHFFVFDRDHTSPEEFASYLKSDFLNREYLKALILTGEDLNVNSRGEILSSLEHLLPESKENLIKQVQISICDFNSTRFSIEEVPKLTVDIKNVPTLFIKIFEINTENYYFNKKQSINSAMSLEGLIATYEDTYSFTDKPQILVRRTFELDKVPQRRGIYFIELIGNGVSSRAIIKKGNLTLITRATVNGQILYILDENQNICIGQSTGVWINEQFYNSDINTGAILIPYMKSSSNATAILLHEGFAEIAGVNLETEKYNLEGSFILNSESIMMGNVTKLLIKPILFVNTRLAELKNLKNPKITISLIKTENEQTIPITNVYEGAIIQNKLDNNLDPEIEFQIPPRLTSISVTFQAEVKNKSEDIMQSLFISKQFPVDSVNIYAKFFLKKTLQGYFIQLLGKNGEPKSLVQVNFDFNHSVLNFKSPCTLQTNSSGEIFLGNLKGVKSFRTKANYRGNTISDYFDINENNSIFISTPFNIDILEGEEVKIPIGRTKEDFYEKILKNRISFVKQLTQSDYVILENCLNNETSSALKINTYPDSIYQYLQVGPLSQGYYKLTLIEDNIIISINVHKGRYWDSNHFLVTNNGIFENNQEKSVVHIEKLNYSNKKLTIKVSNNTNYTRVHISAYNFQNPKEFINSNSINLITNKTIVKKNFPFDKFKNIYLSNRTLNEEVQYVFDRKHYERFIGNSLDKPSLLLKRQFVRDTTTLIQEAKEGTQYEDFMVSDINRDREIGGGMMRKKMGAQNLLAVPLSSSDLLCESICPDKSLNTFHNFLANSPLILTNLQLDDSSNLEVELDLSNYSNLNILIVNNSSVYEENVSLDYNMNKLRDLSMTNPLDKDKSFSELRKSITISKDSKFRIEDITSTSFQIIDSLDKYLNFLTLTDNFSNINNDWTKLNFLLKFEEMNNNERLKKVSEYFCHEVNLFLYFKHYQFFIENIQPVLKYKSEKTFVDFFLMEDICILKRFALSPSKYNQLNAFEQCLLIYSFRKLDRELAKSIAINIRNNSTKILPQTHKRLFNIIINMIKSDEVDINRGEIYSNESAIKSAPMMMNFAMKKNALVMASQKKMCRKESKFESFVPSESSVERANILNNLNKENGKSKEYSETHYYSRTNHSCNYRNFYADLAEFWANNPDSELCFNFVSDNIIEPISNLTELVTTLAVLDLPNYSKSHQITRLEGRGLEIIPLTNMIVFTKEISETLCDIKTHLMIAQVVNKIGDNRTVEDDSEINSDSGTNIFLINQVYQHESIVTNISNKTLTFELLIQIPSGSIPVNFSEYTRTNNITLEKFKTSKYDTFFYFPSPGKFSQFPPNASIDGIVVTNTKPIIYDVRELIIKSSHSTLDDVLETGTKREIIEFLSQIEILRQEDISKVYWLLKDREFYTELLRILNLKKIYDYTVWSFSFMHKDVSTICEFLSKNGELCKIVGPYADYQLIKVNDTSNFNIMNHKDYHPILNSRVHMLNTGSKEKNSKILNRELRITYNDFIKHLICQKALSHKELIRLCYYLILQDRIEDAVKVYERIDGELLHLEFNLQLQYDYISAYLDFSTGYPEFKTARKVSEKYTKYPFPLNYWREMFEEISDQLLEFDGKESFDDIENIVSDIRRKKQTSKLAASVEQKIQFTIEKKSLNIVYSNIKSISIKLYLIDLEILFSRTPFIKQNSENFCYVQPNFTEILQTSNDSKDNLLVYAPPSEFLNSNLFIEVSSGTKRCFDTYFPTSLIINISEVLGEVKVLDQKLQPLTKVYVKCFAKFNNDEVKFYKDGYTDLRGKFNYVSLNTNQIKNIKRFSLFIADDNHGGTIRECSPPSGAISDDSGIFQGSSESEYDQLQNYRQEIKTLWKNNKNIN